MNKAINDMLIYHTFGALLRNLCGAPVFTPNWLGMAENTSKEDTWLANNISLRCFFFSAVTTG